MQYKMSLQTIIKIFILKFVVTIYFYILTLETSI